MNVVYKFAIYEFRNVHSLTVALITISAVVRIYVFGDVE